MRDITERKRTEAALHESERQFGTMVNTIPQLAWMANADGHIFWYNQRWFDYTGTSLVHMEEWGWRSVHDPEFLPVVLERWQTSIATGEVFEMEFPLRAADGHFGWFLTRVFPFKDAEGQVVRWFGTNTDLSEQRKAADEISRLNANLEQRVAERTSELEAFSYTVSHDLRAPLRHLQGYVELLTRETAACPLPDPAQRHLRTIAEVSGEMGQLIDDLLAFSRVGKVDLRRTRVLPNELVQEVIGGLDMAVRERPIDWQIATLPPVLGDPSALKQLFANLIGNAVKYTRPRDPARIEIGCSGETNGRLTLFVRDNGVGFDTQYSHKLFGVFQRLHRAQDFEGTGIGLAIVQRIVKRHDGRVWAESALNQGATFYFTLQPATANYREDTA
jgi:PAS domain S-box-containing protein